MDFARLLLWRFGQFIIFYVRSKNIYHLHHSFVYEFCQKVLEDQRNFYIFGDIEVVRERYRHNHTFVTPEDHGAGNPILNKSSDKYKTVSQIYKRSSSTRLKGYILTRIVLFVKAKKIIELGTNLGIGSAHLHGAMRSSIFVGIEASKTFVEFTERTLNTLHLGNYQIKHGNFDEYFKDILLSNQDADLIFIDGNHRYDATIRYYKLIKRYVPKECLIIFDDIHWNKDMKKAWNWITQDKECMLSINLFQIGLVWINRTNRSSPKNYSLIPFRLKPLPF